MKNIIGLFLIATLLFFYPCRVSAQKKPNAEITSVKQKDKTVLFTIISSKKFYVGGNVYILHIDDKEYGHSTQSFSKGKGSLTFFIPVGEFNRLNEGADIYLTYGHPFKNEQQHAEALAKQDHGPYWALGKFSKKMLIQ